MNAARSSKPVIFMVILFLSISVVIGSFPKSYVAFAVTTKGPLECRIFPGGDFEECCQTTTYDDGLEIHWCTVCDSDGTHCGPRYPEPVIAPAPSTGICTHPNAALAGTRNCAPLTQTLEALAPGSAPIQYTHRRVLDDPAGNKVGWNPDGQTKVFGIVDSKFNPQTSAVLINTFNPVLPGVVCDVDHRGYAAAGPAFEVNCGGENPSAVAPMNGTALDYLIITMPFSPPDTGIFNPTTGGVIPRINMTDSAQMENQTQVIRPMYNSSS
jgi:hypothetical protein